MVHAQDSNYSVFKVKKKRQGQTLLAALDTVQ